MVEDGMVLIGAGAIAYGAWLWSEPAGFVSAGVLLVAGGLARARARMQAQAGGDQ